jgi:hypothetical protein
MRHPTVGHGCLLGAGVSVIGPVVIGAGSKVWMCEPLCRGGLKVWHDECHGRVDVSKAEEKIPFTWHIAHAYVEP